MTQPLLTALASAVLTAMGTQLASASAFSWFDDSPARDSLGQLRPPSALFDREKRLAFGIEAYKTLRDNNVFGSVAGDASLTFYGEFAGRENDVNAPIGLLNRGAGDPAWLDGAAGRLSGFGVKWQHRLDATNTVSVAAGYSELSPSLVATLPANIDAFDTRASLSWTGTWDGGWRPGLMGSVFVGDGLMRDEAYRRLGRPYYGFSVGGQLQLAQTHTPYFSYRLQRNFNENDLASDLMPFHDERSQFAAGWIWQVQRNWSVQAEASYGLNGATLDPSTPDRSRLYFGTRFDFR
jgi:hypothetical protein